jgi:NAD kinase
MSTPRRVILVTRKTRLELLIAQHNTLGQARFYLERLGADFGEYQRESEVYAASLATTMEALHAWGRYQVLERSHLSNFIFAPDDIVVALGQDGLVANTLKYLNGQPLVGVNPDPARWDGVLLPFEAAQLVSVLPGIARDERSTAAVTLAEARLSDGQVMRAVNDIFVGPRSHTSALYDIEYRQQTERQSSSGLIVSTGLGSTAWISSVIAGSLGIAQAITGRGEAAGSDGKRLPWDTDRLLFAVREPFKSRQSAAKLVYGAIDADQPLLLRSRMPEGGIIFSDGMESDYLDFTAGMEARIGICSQQGWLVQ